MNKRPYWVHVYTTELGDTVRIPDEVWPADRKGKADMRYRGVKEWVSKIEAASREAFKRGQSLDEVMQ